ncbi:hypothetical protein DOY81_003527 [Sarcophaga bullata]|nr:hypothetical protein DOY81_003527 [Sarcophaga bullata]
MEAFEEDIDENDLLHDLYDEDGQHIESIRLSEMVRKHYLKYLEKQLNENLQNSCFNTQNCDRQNEDYDGGLYEISIKKTAQLLEDKAVKACMIAKFYQRAMIKIIAIVRRSTHEKKLMHQLERCLQAREETSTKATQTETSLLQTADNQNSQIPTFNGDYDKPTVSLDDKIKMFEDRLKKEKCLEVAKKYSLTSSNGEYKKSKTYHKNHNTSAQPRRFRHHHNDNKCLKPKEEINFSPTPSIGQPTTPITRPALKQDICPETSVVHSAETKVIDDDYTNDSVALELARMFSEEKTELDEIFGIDPNDEPDDPQICKILKEIRAAKISQVNSEKMQQPLSPNVDGDDVIDPNNYREQNHLPQQGSNSFADVDLSKSIWPCELFKQKRTLSESLARLLEEDLRWHDIMKWKFLQLFGEDSDDEFTPCSPSIELNEVLIGSCIRRISPWIVKHLMKPMREGLIGNRFLFKKLAKHLARSIIMENQYPDESLIKNYVENFFCLYQSVMALEDLDVDMPSILSL